MRLWQALWTTSGNFYIWGESQEKFEAFANKNSSTSDSNSHPFCLSHEELEEDLDNLQFDPDDKCEISIWLPSEGEANQAPQPSPRLASLSDHEVSSGPKLKSWKVSALKLEPLSTVAFLSSIPKEIPEGLKLEDSFRTWVTATKLLLDMLAHGRFLPTIAREDGDYVSHWQVSLNQEKDRDRLKEIARCLPSLCRLPIAEPVDSESQDSSQEVTEETDIAVPQSPFLVVESFLATCSDALIRIFVKNQPLAPEDCRSDQEAARAWLEQLGQPKAPIVAHAHEVLKLEEKVKLWSNPMLTSGSATGFQTAFFLKEPSKEKLLTALTPGNDEQEDEEKSWAVEFLLQSTTDEKVRLPAEEFWEGNLGFLIKADVTAEEVENKLLGNLGRAAGVFPQLGQALESARPCRVELSTKEAWVFLKETAPLLEQAEFSVISPSWWSSAANKLGLVLEVNPPGGGNKNDSGFLGLGSLVDFSWSIAIGDKRLSPDEFKALVEQDDSLVNVGGEWVELKKSSLEKTLKFLDQQAKLNKLSLFDAMRLGLGLESDSETLPVVDMRSGGWLNSLFSSDAPVAKKMDQPKDFNGSLRAYQLEGLSWLKFVSEVGLGGCLADDMGLGKTIQLISLIAAEKSEQGEEYLPNLLVVPMSIIDNWDSEIKKFSPGISTYIHHGPARLGGGKFIDHASKSNVVITTYSLLGRDLDAFRGVRWGRVALDEAQNIKNTATRQSKAVRELTYEQVESSRTDGKPFSRLALTGTPLENHLDELWSIFDFLNPGFLGKNSEFRNRFSIPIERYKDEEATKALNRVISPFILRRLKTDPGILNDLPEKIEMEVLTNLTEEQATLYQKVLDQLLPEVGKSDGIHRKGLVLSVITKLKQICNHPSLFLKDDSDLTGRSGKLDRLEQLLEVIMAEGDKVLVFSQYAQMGHLLRKHLTKKFGQEALFFHGGQTKETRKRIIDTFQDPKGPQILLLSLKAGGFGLNLTAANQVIHYDQWWNPAVQEQATDRAYRIGQKKNVQVRKFICKGTLEERIAGILENKKSLADSIVGSPREVITEMNLEELQDLLSLGGARKQRVSPDSDLLADEASLL